MHFDSPMFCMVYSLMKVVEDYFAFAGNIRSYELTFALCYFWTIFRWNICTVIYVFISAIFSYGALY